MKWGGHTLFLAFYRVSDFSLPLQVSKQTEVVHSDITSSSSGNSQGNCFVCSLALFLVLCQNSSAKTSTHSEGSRKNSSDERRKEEEEEKELSCLETHITA